MSKKNVVTLRLPQELKNKLSKVAELQGISINQFALYIFAKEVTRLEILDNNQSQWQKIEQEYLGIQTKEDIKKEFNEILKSVKASENIPEWDQIK